MRRRRTSRPTIVGEAARQEKENRRKARIESRTSPRAIEERGIRITKAVIVLNQVYSLLLRMMREPYPLNFKATATTSFQEMLQFAVRDMPEALSSEEKASFTAKLDKMLLYSSNYELMGMIKFKPFSKQLIEDHLNFAIRMYSLHYPTHQIELMIQMFIKLKEYHRGFKENFFTDEDLDSYRGMLERLNGELYLAIGSDFVVRRSRVFYSLRTD
ncbi:hypothetical protein KAU11_11715 [Candidatus Babeliales bacterium]|nr:hypothetical protein [Candidatus Babeliales bacterium]